MAMIFDAEIVHVYFSVVSQSYMHLFSVKYFVSFQ